MLLNFARLAMVMLMVLVEQNWVSRGLYTYRLSKTDLETGARPECNTNCIHRENFNDQPLGSKITLKERGCRGTAGGSGILASII
jgi:hypothetical protein